MAVFSCACCTLCWSKVCGIVLCATFVYSAQRVHGFSCASMLSPGVSNPSTLICCIHSFFTTRIRYCDGMARCWPWGFIRLCQSRIRCPIELFSRSSSVRFTAHTWIDSVWSACYPKSSFDALIPETILSFYTEKLSLLVCPEHFILYFAFFSFYVN